MAEPTILHRVPEEATHWSGRAMAETAGISLRSAQRIWAAHDLQPHRIRTFKRSNDPEFAAKLADIVGLYVDPPKHAIVLSVEQAARPPILATHAPDPHLVVLCGNTYQIARPCATFSAACQLDPAIVLLLGGRWRNGAGVGWAD